jgi:hypothetical protein
MELLIPSVAMDFNMPEKFLKLPIKAMPEVPRNTAMILDEKIPNIKLTTTEIEFRDSTFNSL